MSEYSLVENKQSNISCIQYPAFSFMFSNSLEISKSYNSLNSNECFNSLSSASEMNKQWTVVHCLILIFHIFVRSIRMLLVFSFTTFVSITFQKCNTLLLFQPHVSLKFKWSRGETAHWGMRTGHKSLRLFTCGTDYEDLTIKRHTI